MSFFDDSEVRSADEREADLVRALSRAIDDAKHTPGMARSLRDVDPDAIGSLDDLARLPVIRRADLVEAQLRRPPLGGLTTRRPTEFDHVFQAPGPVYAPGRRESDWWRLGRFLHAADIGSGDIVHNSFSYHLTAMGMMFESGARAVGAAVLPAGPGQTDLQLQAARDIGADVHAGPPDFLRMLLERADELGLDLSFSRAVMAGAALTTALRKAYRDRGIMARQCYATPDLGLVAYETEAMEGMVVDECVIVEILRPGTGEPVAEGDMGEVVVTTLNPDYPLIRFATGDLSAMLPGQSPCGRTNRRIRGWLGRVEQTSRIGDVVLHPGQIAKLIARFPEVSGARVLIDRVEGEDRMTIRLETAATDPTPYSEAVRQALRLSGTVELVAPGGLPGDGKVIEDRRTPQTGPEPGADAAPSDGATGTATGSDSDRAEQSV